MMILAMYREEGRRQKLLGFVEDQQIYEIFLIFTY
jgi:hypothetical protein